MRARLVDKVIVSVTILFCVVGVGRALVGVGVLPFTVGQLALQARGSSADGTVAWGKVFTAASRSAYEHPLYMQWWGSRRRPRVAGDDYLEALAKRPLDRILGIVLGEVVRRERDSGTRIESVTMPNDLAALIGKDSAASFERADGSVAVVNLRHPEEEFEWLSGVRAERLDYDPLLSDAAVASLSTNAGLTFVTTGVWLAGADDAVSGRWVLYSNPSAVEVGGREFFLVPWESLPPEVRR